MSKDDVGLKEAVKVEFASVQDDEGEYDEDRVKLNLELIYGIPVSVSAELGRTSIPIRELLALKPGSVVELDRVAGESIDLLVNGVKIGSADVVVVQENFGLRITEIVGVPERLDQLSD